MLAYTNCNIVELFLNGRSLGEKRLEFPAQGTSGGWNSYAQPLVNPTTTDLHLSWDVPYEPGVLRAVGKRRDGTVGMPGGDPNSWPGGGHPACPRTGIPSPPVRVTSRT